MSMPDAKETADKTIKLLKKEYPAAKIQLLHKNPLELMVATILSAQCTDKRVNIVTKELFKKYRAIDDYADADRKAFEQAIRSTGFYRNKAKNIISACKIIRERHNGKVPHSMEELVQLPGIARKTANIILSGAFGRLDGIAVDTHVARLSQRLGLSKNKDPVKIELDLMQIVPKREWWSISTLLINHGRAVCTARKPKCNDCILSASCPSAFRF